MNSHSNATVATTSQSAITIDTFNIGRKAESTAFLDLTDRTLGDDLLKTGYLQHQSPSATPASRKSNTRYSNRVNTPSVTFKDDSNTTYHTDEKHTSIPSGETFASEPWNLDTYGLNRLQRIIRNSSIRKLQDNPNIGKNRFEVRMYKLEQYILSQQAAYLLKRVKLSSISAANRYAIMGEELLLRNELLLGHPVNQRDFVNGRTILHDAAACGHAHLIHLICHAYKANMNTPTMLGSTSALHLAIENNHRQVVSLLLTYGSDVNMQDRRGCTPIFYVQKMTILKLLLRFNDRLDLAVRSGEKLLPSEHYNKYISQNEHDSAIELLLQKSEAAAAIVFMKNKMDKINRLNGNGSHDDASRNFKELKLVISQDSTLESMSYGKKAHNKIRKGNNKEDDEEGEDDDDDDGYNSKYEKKSMKEKNTYAKVNKEKKYRIMDKGTK